MNIDYVVEMLDGHIWRLEYSFDNLVEAIKEMNQLKTSLPKRQFRILKCQWEVIE